jgi:glucokinase
MRLLVDLGGTNLRCALQAPGEPPSYWRKVRCAECDGPAGAIAKFLESANGERPRRAAMAVAAPLAGDFVRMTNRAWSFSAEELRRQLGLEELHVVNDFTAVAMSLPFLPPEGCIAVGGGQAATHAAIGVLGPGTGLGVSGLVPAGGRYVALASEGGHMTLPASDEREAAVIAVLRRRGHVSAERLVSGFGLSNLYGALCELAGKPDAGVLPPQAITLRAQAGDALAAEALGYFFAFLGTVAADVALVLGARGGMYIAGGIVPRLRDEFLASGFRPRFESKGRYSDYLAAIPTWLVIEPNPAFRGLAAILDGHRAEP